MSNSVHTDSDNKPLPQAFEAGKPPLDTVQTATLKPDRPESLGGAQGQTKPVFAIGQLVIDYGNETRLNSFAQSMKGDDPKDAMCVLKCCEKLPALAAAVHWILAIDSKPIYAIQPQEDFAPDVFQRLRESLKEQLCGGAERVSIPGLVGGEAIRLMSGQNVPILVPDVRGMNNWETNALIEEVCGKPPAKSSKEQEVYTKKVKGVQNFLARIYHELRNVGTSPEDRALNYAATNAVNQSRIFEAVLKDRLQLDSITVEQSPISKPALDCWDVKLTFFDPNRQLELTRKVYRLTVDISDVCPAMVGTVRSWSMR